jgi:hypothetical protein
MPLSDPPGLSAPFNSWFTFFGQFFDHGLDLVNKSSTEFVMMPLQPDDPLYVAGSHTNFMVVSRVTRTPTATRRTRPRPSSTRTRPTPRIPRTRCSCASTCSMRAGHPVATGKLLDHADGGLPPGPT